MLIIHQHWLCQLCSEIFYILSKCKKNAYIKGTESISLWQRLTHAYIMARGLEAPCCSGKRKHSLGTSPRKGKTSPLLFPHTICSSMSSYFSRKEGLSDFPFWGGLSQLLFLKPFCVPVSLLQCRWQNLMLFSTATKGCLPGKTIKIFSSGRGASCLISKGNRTRFPNRQLSHAVHI